MKAGVMTTIYALHDPEDNGVRWVGRTQNMAVRLRAHMQPKVTETTPRAEWIRSLKAKGLQPVMRPLDRGRFGSVEACKRERHWITSLLASGEPLLNVALTEQAEAPDQTLTRGRLALAEWQAADKAARTRAAIARSLGCAHTTVMRWLDGTSRPDAEQRLRLHALTGIKPDDWRTTEERAAVVEPLADTIPPGAA